MGRAEAAPHAGGHRRARARLLRLGGGQGAAGHSLARRRVRPAPPRRRGAPARQGAGEALPRPAARRVPAGRRAAQPRRGRAPEEGARDGRRRRRRHPAFRAHDGRGIGERSHPVRDRGGARAPRRHALRRDRRPQFSPHRDARDAGASPRPAGARQRIAPHVHALDGQLLRVEAHPAHGGVGRERGRQPAHQHHDPGSPRHLSQAARDDARSRAHGGRRDRGVRQRLRDGPVVQPRQRRHAGGGIDGPARRADDRRRRHARVLRRRHGERREGHCTSKATASRRASVRTSCCFRRATRWRRSACAPRGSRWCARAR